MLQINCHFMNSFDIIDYWLKKVFKAWTVRLLVFWILVLKQISAGGIARMAPRGRPKVYLSE